MKNTYFNLIDQSYSPQDGFDLHDGDQSFHGISLKHQNKKHIPPCRLMHDCLEEELKLSVHLPKFIIEPDTIIVAPLIFAYLLSS